MKLVLCSFSLNDLTQNQNARLKISEYTEKKSEVANQNSTFI